MTTTLKILDRGRIDCDLNFLLEGHTVGTHSNPNPDMEFVEIPVPGYIIDHLEGTILWDTGSHHEAKEGAWSEELVEAFYPKDCDDHRLDDDLEDAGYSVDEIDYVFQSHLHMDHAGGLEFFAGTDTPIFVHETELKWAYYSATSNQGGSAYELSDFNHELNWQILHSDEESHFDGIKFLRLPGHTPGFTGTMVDIGDETIIIAGDELPRVDSLENEHPPGVGDWSKPHWFRSMKKIKQLQNKHDATVLFGHDLDAFLEAKSRWG